MKTISIPDYMSKAMEEQSNNARRKKQQKLWERNPVSGKKVVAVKYNDRLQIRVAELEK